MTELNVIETSDTGEPLTEDKTLENLTCCLCEIKNRTSDDISDIAPLGESKSAAWATLYTKSIQRHTVIFENFTT